MLDPRDPEHPLRALRSRIRRLIWWSGASCCLTALFGGLVFAGGFDWWLRIDDPGLRTLLAATMWCVVGVTLWRTLLGPLRAPLSDVFLAEQIERRYAGFAGRISSAAAFRSADCSPQLGSPELQRMIIAEAESELEHVDPRQVAPTRWLQPMAVSGLAMCAVAIALLGAFPLEAATAVRRLVWPWGHHPWPQATVLRLLARDGTPLTRDPHEPWQLVRGDTLELLVENERGRLPEAVWLETRLAPDVPPLREALQRVPTAADGKSGRDRARISLPAVHGPLEFRAVGGDDRSMPWHSLHVVEPPTLTAHEIQITPPEYTGQSIQVLPQGSTQIRGWLGSKVKITATADRPLHSVHFTGRDRAPLPLTLSSDGLAWMVEFTIEKPDPSAVWFQLRDRQDFTEREPLQFSVRGDIDAWPQVSLQQPATDLMVTPDAEVPLEVEAQDDLGIRTLRLAWLRNDEPQETLPLFEYAELRTETHETASWKLSEWKLSPGDRVVFRIEALDACTIGAEHVAKSGPRTLLVESPQDKRSELQARTGELVEDLRDAAELQTRLRDQTQEVQTQLQTTSQLRPQERDLLRRVEFDQRNLAARLNGGPTSLAERAGQLQSEFESNGLSDPETQTGLEQLTTHLRELTRTTTPQVTHELTQAGKLIAGDADKTPEDSQNASKIDQETAAAAAQALAEAARHQADVIDALSDLQSLLSEWRGQRDIGREVSGLVEEQDQLLTATSELGAQTIAKSAAELSPQQRADLAKLAARQRRQAERIGQLQQQLQQLHKAWQDQELTAAEAAGDAAERLQDAEAEARARQAAGDIAANRLGQAGELQRAIRDALAELQREWNEQQPDDAEMLVKRLEGLERDAQSIAQDHDELRKRNDGAAQPSPDKPSPAEQAAELRRRTQRLERQLERLRLRRAAETARRAADRLRSREKMSSDDAEERRQAEQEAAQELEQLQQELAQERRSAEERLAQEQFERIAQSLEAFKNRQLGVIAETERLEQEREARGQWTRGQLRSLKDLADVERGLAEEARNLVRQLEGATTLEAAMNYVVRSMSTAAGRLAERQTDAVTLRHERDAVRRIEQLLAAWNARPSIDESASDQEQPQQSSEEDKPAGPPGEAVPTRVQLQLLRNWQADCLERTAAWHKEHPDPSKLSESEQAELQQLADEQGELAKLAQELVDAIQSSRPQTPEPKRETQF